MLYILLLLNVYVCMYIYIHNMSSGEINRTLYSWCTRPTAVKVRRQVTHVVMYPLQCAPTILRIFLVHLLAITLRTQATVTCDSNNNIPLHNVLLLVNLL